MANDPDSRRSVMLEPAGTATNTLSDWIPLRMIRSRPKLTSVPLRFSVIEVNDDEPLFGASTKCQ